MSKHTPGPWFYNVLDEWSHNIVTHHGYYDTGKPKCWAIATVNKNREPEHVYNARLIAAAPDLLEALKTALATLTDQRIGTISYMEGSKCYEDFRTTAERIAIAIEKATS